MAGSEDDLGDHQYEGEDQDYRQGQDALEIEQRYPRVGRGRRARFRGIGHGLSMGGGGQTFNRRPKATAAGLLRTCLTTLKRKAPAQ